MWTAPSPSIARTEARDARHIGREFEHGAVAFFELTGHLRLALFPRDSIAHDSGLPRSGRGVTEFTLGHNVKNEADVHAVMREAQAAGAHIVKPAGKTVWGGRAGYFQDPDGHLWEVAWNPFAPLGPNGEFTLPA